MANEFDLGLNIASIETELPDPVITLTGSDNLTAAETAEMPLLSLTAYGRSWQSDAPTAESPVSIENIGDSGSLTVTACGKNLLSYAESGVKTRNGLTVESFGNGEYHVYGTVTAAATVIKFPLVCPSFIPDAKIYLSLNNTSAYSNIASISFADADGNEIGSLGINTVNRVHTTSTYNGKTIAAVSFYVANGNSVDYYIKPQFEIDNATEYEHYKSTAATVTTGLPLRGLPVSSGGNYTDSNGQEWICDTLEHVFGEPAQVTRRIAVSSVSDVALDTLGMKSVIQFDANYINHPGTSYRWYRYYCDYIVVYESPSAAYGVFYECHGVRYGENCDLGPYVTESSSITGQWGRPEEFTFYGDIRVSDSLKSRVSIKPVVTLADGTTDPETYICETEKLTVGAEVIYPQKAETVLLTTEETQNLNKLSGFAGSTTIYNDNTAEMTVKLLREDFEMQYIHWIKESQSFVCEKAGKYKIICVGGGSSGGIGAAGAAETMQAAGTTTSFGTIISAEGGGKSRALVGSMHIGSGALIGGQSGYDGINYGSTSHVMTYESAVHFSSTGSNSSVMWGTGHGYGAGGGARSYSDELLAAGGRCGKVESTIVDLEENQTIACTIGGGGVLVLSDANVLEYLKTYVDPEKTSATGEGEKVSACVSSGADGVIVIQYLGL